MELGIGFVPYCPLGRAFLTGVIDETSRFPQSDRRHNLPMFTPEALRYNLPLVQLVRKWAEKKNLTSDELDEFDLEYSRINITGHCADPFIESQIDK